MNNPAKDFGQIASEYAFFEEHSTEAQADIRAYREHIATIKPSAGTVNMLDFGCGSGTFTMRFLQHAGWSSEHLHLTLVEPAESQRRKAVTRLAPLVESLTASASLPSALDHSFDLVLANHVFYYVPDVRDTLSRLISALTPGGVLLLAIASRTNLLVDLSIACFRLLGREIPYKSSEDVEPALRALSVDYAKQQVPYEVSFSDTEENRARILRFLLADHLTPSSSATLLDWFDRYSHDGRIEIRTETDHYTLRGSD